MYESLCTRQRFNSARGLCEKPRFCFVLCLRGVHQWDDAVVTTFSRPSFKFNAHFLRTSCCRHVDRSRNAWLWCFSRVPTCDPPGIWDQPHPEGEPCVPYLTGISSALLLCLISYILPVDLISYVLPVYPLSNTRILSVYLISFILPVYLVSYTRTLPVYI